MKEQLQIIKSPEYKRQKSKTPEEQRLAEIRALKKERAHNNARIKAELVALGEMPTRRKPPKRPIKAEEKIDKIERDINEKLTHIIETVVRDNESDNLNQLADLPTKADIASLAADNGQIAQVGANIADLKDTLKILLMQMSKPPKNDDNLSKTATLGEAYVTAATDNRLERVGTDIADLKESMQMLISQISKPNYLHDENCSAIDKTNSAMGNRQIEQSSTNTADLKDTLESLILQMKNLYSRNENQLVLGKVDSPDNSQIERVSADVAGLKESIQTLILQMSKPNFRDESQCCSKSNHNEIIAACYHMRTPHCVLQHTVQSPHPQIPFHHLRGQMDNAEMDKVRTEMSDVRDAVNSLTHAFSSYNMGKMHSAVDALKGNPHSTMHYQQQAAPAAYQSQFQPIQPQPLYFQPQAASQPIIVNTPPQTVQQPQTQPIIVGGASPQACTQPHENHVSLTNNHMYPQTTQAAQPEYSLRSAFYQPRADIIGTVQPQPQSSFQSAIHNGTSPLGHENIQENNISQINHERLQPQAQQTIEKQDSSNKESSGLAAMLAKMSATLDGLADDMK